MRAVCVCVCVGMSSKIGRERDNSGWEYGNMSETASLSMGLAVRWKGLRHAETCTSVTANKQFHSSYFSKVFRRPTLGDATKCSRMLMGFIPLHMHIRV